MLAAQAVTFGFEPDRPILRDVDAVLAPGAVTVLLGPNGAGKTTLLRVLAGLLKPQKGTVWWRAAAAVGEADGVPPESVYEMDTRSRAARIAYVPQATELAFEFTVRDVVAMGRFAAGPRQSGPIDAALTAIGLTDRASDRYSHLSAGQRQRVNLARALAQLAPFPGQQPRRGRVLLADEPCAAMDPRHSMLSLDLVRGLAHQGVAVGLVLHDLALAARFADRVLAIDDHGRVAAAGPAADVLTESTLARLFGVGFVRLAHQASGATAFVPAG